MPHAYENKLYGWIRDHIPLTQLDCMYPYFWHWFTVCQDGNCACLWQWAHFNHVSIKGSIGTFGIQSLCGYARIHKLTFSHHIGLFLPMGPWKKWRAPPLHRKFYNAIVLRKLPPWNFYGKNIIDVADIELMTLDYNLELIIIIWIFD